jgi:hypothetical protein
MPVSVTDVLPELIEDHSVFGGVAWRLAKDGIRIAGNAPETTGGAPKTVQRVWENFGDSIDRWSQIFEVPAELIIATICTESSGKPQALRKEPGYVSDEATPGKISPGLMQTLISTARATLKDPGIDRAWLLDPDNSIKAGTCYIAENRDKTRLDPPKVACAYNAGGIFRNDGPGNRWKMRQFPIGKSDHADRFVAWFNDCFRFFPTLAEPPSLTFWGLLKQGPAGPSVQVPKMFLPMREQTGYIASLPLLCGPGCGPGKPVL